MPRGGAKYKIPDDLKAKLRRPVWRRQLLQKCGKRAFIIPDKLSYPVMDDKCNYRLCLLHAAYVRLREFHRYKEADKVKKMLEKLEKMNKTASPKLESTFMTFDEEFTSLFGSI